MNKKDFLIELSKTNFDSTISKFMLFKELNGNGVGAGKWFENVFTWFINKNVNGWYALKLNLTNSDWCVHDLIVSPNSEIVDNFDEFLSIKTEVEQIKSNSDERIKLLHELLNKRFGVVIGISAKTYKELDAQLTTSNEPREYLDENVDKIIEKQFNLESFLNKLGTKTNESQLILGLNTFEDGSYRITNLDLNKLKSIVTEITYEKMKVHTRFFLKDSEGNKIVDFKYGGKTANPFQRGIWVCNKKDKKGKGSFSGLKVFDSVLEGTYMYKGDSKKWESKIQSLFV